MLVVILYVSIYFPLNKPDPIQVEVVEPSIEECLREAGAFLQRIKIDMPEATYETSCSVEVPRHLEH